LATANTMPSRTPFNSNSKVLQADSPWSGSVAQPPTFREPPMLQHAVVATCPSPNSLAMMMRKHDMTFKQARLLSIPTTEPPVNLCPPRGYISAHGLYKLIKPHTALQFLQPGGCRSASSVTGTPCDQPAAQPWNNTLWQAGSQTDTARHQHTLTNQTDQPSAGNRQRTGPTPGYGWLFTFSQRISKPGPSAGTVMARTGQECTTM
jgi:hypothetical protein